MIKAIQDHKPFVTKVLKSLILPIAMFALAGCAGDNEAATQDDNVSFALPDTLLGNRVDRTNLSATISVNGGTPQAMLIDDGTDSASASLTDIPTGDVTFTIVFTYDFGGTILTVAQASQTVAIAEGSNNVSFSATDFDTASFDEDGDGISNIAELDETSTSDPTVETCRIGTDTTDSSTLNNCELG